MLSSTEEQNEQDWKEKYYDPAKEQYKDTPIDELAKQTVENLKQWNKITPPSNSRAIISEYKVPIIAAIVGVGVLLIMKIKS